MLQTFLNALLISLVDEDYKENWAKCYHTHTQNKKNEGGSVKLFYLKHHPGSCVGAVSALHVWQAEPWHLFSYAIITLSNNLGIDIVIYDVDCVLKEDVLQAGKLWSIKCLSLHRRFIGYCKRMLK